MIPPKLIGAFKTFGAFGPAYQALQPVQPLEDGDWVVKVRILETGEEVDYRYARIMDDPQAT